MPPRTSACYGRAPSSPTAGKSRRRRWHMHDHDNSHAHVPEPMCTAAVRTPTRHRAAPPTGRHLCLAPLRTHATLLDLTRHGSILEDDVAYELLPESTRGFVSPAAVGAWSAFLPFCDWIKVGGVGGWSVVGGVQQPPHFNSNRRPPSFEPIRPTAVHVAFECCAPRRRLNRLTHLASPIASRPPIRP